MIRNVMLAAALGICLISCIDKNPNLNKKGEDLIERHLTYVNSKDHAYRDTVYIPVYSDIYSEVRTKSILLTATLSIRSTSLKDTTYINTIDYYNTEGKLVKSFLDRTLVLGPMESIDYVIERDDNTGGSGANFLVQWGADKNVKPIFQCVMIGTFGQYGLAFTTDGVSIKED